MSERISPTAHYTGQVWFKNGPEDPNVVLLKITSRSAEYWDENAPGGPIGTALSFYFVASALASWLNASR